MLSPLWNLGGFFLGAGSAVLGPNSAMACTVAVESIIKEHYAKQLKELGKQDIDKVVGISRGGLIPGVMLSHWLGSGFEPLEWQTRDGEFQDRIKANGFNKNLKGTIFVDDICDSALTIKQIKEIIPKSRWAV